MGAFFSPPRAVVPRGTRHTPPPLTQRGTVVGYYTGINIAPAHTHTRGFTRNIIPPLIRHVKFFVSTSCVPKQNPVFSPLHNTAIAPLSATPPQHFCNSSATIAPPRFPPPLLIPIHRSALAWTADPSTDPVFGSPQKPQFTRREKSPLSKAFQAEKKSAGLRVGSGLRMCAYARCS